MATKGSSVSAQKRSHVRSYRYRTPVLIGPWRNTHQQAIDDALKARQARLDEDDLKAVRWTVNGLIEEGKADCEQ